MTAGPAGRLFTPGRRIGWIFRSRQARPYPRPQPDAERLRQDIEGGYSAGVERVRGQLKVGGSVGGTALLVLCCAAGATIGNPDSAGLAVIAMLLAVPGLLGALGWLGWCSWRFARIQARRRDVPDEVGRHLADWHRAAATWNAAEQARIAALPEWEPIMVPEAARRLDVYGGARSGWEAVLTVLGAGVLARRQRVLVVDLSGDAVGSRLTRLARSAGHTVDDQWLPADLARCDLLAGLTTAALVDVLVEAVHGGTATADRGARSLDADLLGTVCAALDGDVSIARIAAALRVLTGRELQSSVLSEAEAAHIGGALLADDERRDGMQSIRRMAAALQPLADLGRSMRPGPICADLACVSLTSEGVSASGDLLADLMVQWATRLVAGATGDGPDLVVVAGADDIHDGHLRRLSEVCARADVRLFLLFRHLRDHAARMLGDGVVGLMRLAHPEEAGRAAEFIGREHRFVVGGYNRTVGLSNSQSTGISLSTNESVSVGTNVSTSISDNTGTSRSTNRAWGSILPDSSTGGSSAGTTTGTSSGWNRSASTGSSRGTSSTDTTGTSTSEGENLQRVYEYIVEPTTVQALPDDRLLLVERESGGTSVTTVTVSPEIAALPRAAMVPQPEYPW